MTIHRGGAALAFAAALLCAPARGPRGADDFIAFESGHVRPLALSPSRDLLFAVNTPDNRLEVFRAGDGGLERAGECVVGLEPVAVAARSDSEVYVVNHLSDSVSVVDVADPERPFVRATLLVGDEPRDVVIAGPARDRVFITTAHRGQNSAADPQLATPGVGRADVWVFDVGVTSAPLVVLRHFADTPRALAASPDGLRVYAAAFHSGNQTTVLAQLAATTDPGVNDTLIDDGFTGLGMPPPTQSDLGVPAPDQGVILKLDRTAGEWRDAAGRDWTPRTRFHLPDKDIFIIDAAANPPREIGSVRHVGTIIFNLAVNPVTGNVYATNLEAQNHIRFENAVNGRVAENRITICEPVDGAAAEAVHLNPHIDYGSPSGPQAEIDASLAFPLGMEFTPDGGTLYVAAFGSRKVGVLSSAGVVLARIPVGGGPSGLALDPARGRLYVMNRFDGTISIVDTGSRAETDVVPLRFDPEPAAVRAGRPVLYDASASGHGDSACASCHIFADFDSLAWDLGDPAGVVEENPIERVSIQGSSALADFHPMKGPMTTQSLRGLDAAGAMHWRGDRNGFHGGDADPDPFDEGQAFMSFRPAFQGLLGKGTPLSVADMERFRDFILAVRYPPNPIARIDGTLTAQQTGGKQVFDSSGSRTGTGGDGNRCTDCHTLPLGTDGRGSFELEPQDFKVAHLRNLYQKVGMFGYAVTNIIREPVILGATPTPHLGDQVRGFGFLHDGSVPTLFNFFRVPFRPIPPFTFPDQQDRTGNEKVRQLEAFLFTFDTGLKPVVGHQATMTAENRASLQTRYGVFKARATAGHCDLVAHGVVNGIARGFLFAGGTTFQSDRAAESFTEDALLQRIDAGAAITFTAAPPGCGERLALDRDRDGHRDQDELDQGSDPADASSFPGGGNRFGRGDCNGDLTLDISDGVAALLFLFASGTTPPCVDACDSNADTALDVSDPVHLLNFLFIDGPPPGLFPSCEASAGCETDICPGGA
jgi:YVTN family beta-propeller protein